MQITNEIMGKDPEFRSESVLDLARSDLNTIITAISDRDPESLKDILTDELYQRQTAEINDMKSAGRKEILSDMRVIAAYLHLYRRDKSNEYLTVNLSVDLKDYIVDENSFALIEGKTDSLTKHYLLTYNRAKKTLLTIPMEYIGLEGQNSTDKTIAFQDYLLMRIFGYKNGKMRENKILYETLYRDSGQERPEDSKGFIRDRETVVKMMEEWKNKGLITGFAEIKEGRSYVGVEFYTEELASLDQRRVIN